MPIDNKWYDKLGDGWWDPDGIVAPLHEINPTRIAYFCAVLGDMQGMRLLDVGCGGGLVAEEFARRGACVSAVDISLPSLGVARRHAREGGLEIDYAGAMAEHLPFADEAFDAVVTTDTLEHLSEPETLVQEAARVLKPGGRFAYDTVNRTFRARLLLIWLPQNVLRVIPRDSHDYRMLIRPPELHAMMSTHHIENVETRGVPMKKGLVAAGLSYYRRRRLGGFEMGDNMSLSYVGYGVKADHSRPT
jgi:2-polyprenyl-6-hydroxyphenyl methylase/3-demethylubiquinone-9 3-methyltransferase